MKIFKSLLLLPLLLGACTFQSSQEQTNAEAVTAVANTSAELEIKGMTCEVGCKKLIEKTVRKTAGIARFDIDFEHNSAIVEYDSTKIKAEDVVKIINGINNGVYTAVVHDVTAL